MTLARTEYQRFAEMLQTLGPAGWEMPTECPGWTVRDMASHVLGYMRYSGSVREQARQVRAAKRRGGPIADALSGLQVEELADMAPEQITSDVAGRVESATRGRRNAPWPLRQFARITSELPVSGVQETWTLGYLIDTIATRDTWMHRLDICRATGQAAVLTADHDGRLVADIVAEWARRHGRPFTLHLTGRAGGQFASGARGPRLTFDALEFCRALSGRGAELPMNTEVPF